MPDNQTNNNGAQSAGQLLIIDTDTMLSELLHIKFEGEGFKSVEVKSAEEAFALDLTHFNLIIIDMMDEKFTGLDFTRKLRHDHDTYNIPVIIASKHSSEDDIVDGLDAGADDYMAKPFSSRELIARVRSVLRRRRMMSARRAVTELRYNDLVVDLGAGTASIAGEQLSLTRIEYLILAMFLRNRNTYHTRADIQREAWEDETGVSDRAVDTNISRLRKKLGKYGNCIVNRQGFGYGFRE
ncbi:MAG: response regulator transcription factor [Paramuribaculum sp.]|nr:response regulator transcription factor [Paramuribaculum sp.]